jgi:hypothetical protein
MHVPLKKRRRNTVEQIRDEGGHLCTEIADIEAAFVGYYKGLLTSARPQNVDKCISAIGSIITDEMNDKLLATFTKEEVKQALDQMGHLKALGPDGFTASFYQQNWSTVSPEVCDVALYFLNSAHMD